MATDELLHKIYYDPTSPAAFSGIEQLYREAKRQDGTISHKTIRNWLAKQKNYTTNRHSIAKFPRRKTIIPFQFYQFDLDNAFMKNYTKDNDGYGYFILAIDDFSRKVFTRPIKQLTGSNIKDALTSIFEESGQLPTHVRSDKGSEFTNQTVKSFFKKRGVNHFVTQNSTKAAFAERAIYTIKRKLLRAMISQKKKRWLELLPKITSSYNNAFYRSIGMKPNQVTKENEVNIWNKLHFPNQPKPKRKPITKTQPKTYNLNIGDSVKISLSPYIFNRGYNKRFSDENYIIADRSIKQGKEVYWLKDMDNEEIVGSFYYPQLQYVSHNDNDTYEIEKIIKSRNYKGKKQVLIKWTGWDKKFNSWINEDTIEGYNKTVQGQCATSCFKLWGKNTKMMR